MDVIKANGEVVAFDEERIRRSLGRSGAKTSVIEEVIHLVKTKMRDRIPTSELYSIVFGELSRLQAASAGKYKLKAAIMQLGPTGFPFEKLIAALFESDGFTAVTGQIIQGVCVTHEVDVVAKKGWDLHHAECKFHNFRGKVCDVRHALYVDARFRDVGRKTLEIARDDPLRYKGWLITNTRMTSDAIAYGTCSGLGLLSWDYPEEKSLRSWIDTSGLHPLTSLSSLSSKQKRQLLDRGIVLCREIKSGMLAEIGMPRPKINDVLQEAHLVCASSPPG
jgi:hypothetical protein